MSRGAESVTGSLFRQDTQIRFCLHMYLAQMHAAQSCFLCGAPPT